MINHSKCSINYGLDDFIIFFHRLSLIFTLNFGKKKLEVVNIGNSKEASLSAKPTKQHLRGQHLAAYKQNNPHLHCQLI
jgi:hypothetical protein